MVNTAIFQPDVIAQGATEGFSLATEIADFLARKGLAFAIAHEVAGECVKQCETAGIELHELSDQQLQTIHPELTADIRNYLTAQGAVESRISSLATSSTSVGEQLSSLNSENHLAQLWIKSEAKRFTEMMNS